jgi:nitrogen fixation NifU-like protein
MNNEEYYQEVLLDHFKAPRNKAKLEHCSVCAQVRNPACGDRVELSLVTEGENLQSKKIKEVGFIGSGCSISQASASMMTELVKGKTFNEVAHYIELVRKMLKEDLLAQEAEALGDAAALSGVKQFTVRIRCALLAWEALERCMNEEGNA